MPRFKTSTLLFGTIFAAAMAYLVAGAVGGEIIAEAEGGSQVELRLPEGVGGPFAVTVSAEFRKRNNAHHAQPIHARLLGENGTARDLQLLTARQAMRADVYQWEITKRFSSVSEPLVPGQTVHISIEPSEIYRTRSLRVSIRAEMDPDDR